MWTRAQDVINDIDNLRTIPKGEKFICLFSGGKDCGLAIALAIKQEAELYELIHCLNSETNETAWHKQSINLAIEQARYLNSSINILNFGPYQNRNKFVEELKKYSWKGIKYVVCGDIDLGEQAMLEISLCQMAGLNPKMPLLKKSYGEILTLQKLYGIESIITYIEEPDIIDEKYLGQIFTNKTFDEFQTIGIDPLGEDGEFHTTLVNSVHFSSRLKVRFGNKIYSNEGVILPVFISEDNNA